MKSLLLWIYSLIVHLLPETRCFGLKAFLLRRCGARIGRNVRINSSVRILGTGRLEIGDDVWLGAGVFLSPVGDAAITIGSHCDFGPQVMVLTGSHEIDPGGEHIGGRGTAQSVTIGAGSWLGARSTILPGVSLAEKTVVAAGAVVCKDVRIPRSLVAGVPAVLKKAL